MMKTIGIIGEYYPDFQPHTALNAALDHVRHKYGFAFDYEWLATGRVASEREKVLKKFAGIWSAPGSPFKSLEGALTAIHFARTNDIPHLGTCAGFQHAVVEFARNVLGFTNAQHEEYGPTSSQLFIKRLACSLAGRKMKVTLRPGSAAARCYGASETEENYYCNFGLNPQFQGSLIHPDLSISGVDADEEIRIIEIPGNRFFVATLFVPQVNSTPAVPHPMITCFVQASLEKE